MRKIFVFIGLISLLFACDKEDQGFNENIQLKNQWRINNTVKDISVITFNYETFTAEKLYNGRLNVFTGAQMVNNNLTLKGEGSSLFFNIAFADVIEGDYRLILGNKSMISRQFNAYYLLDYDLAKPTPTAAKVILEGKLTILKQSDSYQISFDLKDMNGKIIKGSYTGKLPQINKETVDQLWKESVFTSKPWSIFSIKKGDVFETLNDCISDNVMTFSKDGTYQIIANSSCNPSQPDEDEVGTWYIDGMNMVQSEKGSDKFHTATIEDIQLDEITLGVTMKNEKKEDVKYEYVLK